jgi:hypothetical protein
MAFSGEDQVKVWQKVRARIAGEAPVTQLAFKALREYLATQGGNQQLQYLPFTEADCDAAGGTVVLSGACTLYGVFVKKENSATDNWFWLYDDATNDGTAADAMVCLPLLRANEAGFAMFPKGFALGTGIVVTQYATDPLGASDGSNGGDGFVVIGA